MLEINDDQALDGFKTYRGMLLDRQSHTASIVERMLEVDKRSTSQKSKKINNIVQSCKGNIDTIISVLDEIFESDRGRAAIVMAYVYHALHSHVELGAYVYTSWEEAEELVSRKRVRQMNKARELAVPTEEEEAGITAIDAALEELDWSTLGKRRGASAVASRIERQVDTKLAEAGFGQLGVDAIYRRLRKHPRFRRPS